MRAGFLLLLLVVATWHAPVAITSGQVPAAVSQPAAEPDASTPAPPPAGNGPAVEASRLDTFWLRDSKGNLVPVLGMTFEEFEQLLRLKKGLIAAPSPAFTFDALSITGVVEGEIAKLQVTATVRVREEGWVRIPLRMAAAAMRQSPKHEGPGEQFLTADSTSGEYVCWIKSTGPQPHVITLNVAIGLTSVGNEMRLSMGLPRATESSLRLTVPLSPIEATLNSGDGILSTPTANGNSSEITVLGAAGDMQLTWREARAASAKGPAQLDATGNILVRVESENRISSDARLRVRALGAPLEVFQVRLPPEMELVPISATGYTLTTIATSDETENARTPASGQLVEVRLDKPATAVTEVRLVASSRVDSSPADGLLPARFDVVGAVRQRGTIDFVVDGEWQLDWTEDASVRRLDPGADAASARVAGRFDYFRQPCGLQLRAKARPSRVSIEPSHVIHVDAQQLRIESTFKCRFRGPRTAGLDVELGDWKFDRLDTNDFFEIPDTKSDSGGRVQIPFRPGSASPTEVELKLEAHQALPPQTERVVLSLPRLIADVIAPATVIIDVADNIDLTPLSGEIVGLTPEPTTVRIPFRQQAPYVFRDFGGGEPVLFVAALRIRGQTTTASARAVIQVDRQQIQVEQRLEYRVAHEPQRSFTLLAPRDLPAAVGLNISLNDEPLGITPLAPAPAANERQRLEFSTPAPQIGTFQITVRYALPMPRWNAQEPLPVSIPLIVPENGEDYQFAGQQVDFVLADGLDIAPDLSELDDLALPVAASNSGLEKSFTWPQAATTSKWIVQSVLAGRTAAITISKAWIQTWLSPRVRQERLALQLNTAQEALVVRLPSGVSIGNVQAAINAQSATVEVREAGVARLSVPPAVRGRECVVEIWYALDPPARIAGLLRAELKPAQVDGAAPPRRTYWQLLLPGDEHLLIPPSDLEAEMAWSDSYRMTGPLVRRPLLDQPALERWIGASRQDPVPRGANEYLFGTLGRMPTFSVTVGNRRLLVALGSGGALVLGLLILHVPRLRGPSSLFALAVCLVSISLVSPELAILIGQWSIMGVLVALAAAVWTWLGWGTVKWLRPRAAAGANRPRETPSTQPPILRPDRASPLSTATGPVGAAAEARR